MFLFELFKFLISSIFLSLYRFYPIHLSLSELPKLARIKNMEIEKINPFTIKDILDLVAAYLNPEVTLKAGNSYLRKSWLRRGKVRIFDKYAPTKEKYLITLTEFATSVYFVSGRRQWDMKPLQYIYPKATEITVSLLGDLKMVTEKNFPKLTRLVMKSKIHWTEPVLQDFLNIVHRFPGLTDVVGDIGVITDGVTDKTSTAIFSLAYHFTNIRLELGSGRDDFIEFLQSSPKKIAHYRVRTEYMTGPIQHMLIGACAYVHFVMPEMKLVEVVTTINSMIASLKQAKSEIIGETKNYRRKIVYIFKKIIQEDTKANLTSLYSSLRFSLQDASEMGISISINSSLRWFSELFKKLKTS